MANLARKAVTFFMARPRHYIDEAQLKSVIQLKPTLREVADFFNVSEDTIERHIRACHDCSFAEFRDRNMVHTRFTLIRKAIEKAEHGDNKMLIFCLKNLCGWSEHPFTASHDNKVIQLAYSKEHLIETTQK